MNFLVFVKKISIELYACDVNCDDIAFIYIDVNSLLYIYSFNVALYVSVVVEYFGPCFEYKETFDDDVELLLLSSTIKWKKCNL